jgi:putative flippase GtrA
MKFFDSIFSSDLFGRYFLVITAGFCVDLSVSMTLIKALEISLLLAGSIGYFFGLGFVYFLHESFTFKSSKNYVSIKRTFHYFYSTTFILIMRLLTINFLASIHFFSESIIWVLLIANGLSFLLNYLASVYILFEKKDHLS